MLVVVTGNSPTQYNLSDVYGWYRDLAAQHPSMVTLNDSIGKTHYDRDIMAIHITDKGTRKPGGKLKIYIQCLLHASKIPAILIGKLKACSELSLNLTLFPP